MHTANTAAINYSYTYKRCCNYASVHGALRNMVVSLCVRLWVCQVLHTVDSGQYAHMVTIAQIYVLVSQYSLVSEHKISSTQ